MKIAVRTVETDDWPRIAELFGDRGACGGCWCMAWRLQKKVREASRGDKNRRAMQRLIKSGKATGCLAFAGDEVVGWCSVGPRADFEGLVQSRALRTDWDEDTWSVTCIFIRTGWRGMGVATRLLKGAVELAREERARRLEGYPAVTYTFGKKMPAAFAWTGVASLFEQAGFRDVTAPSQKRPIYLKRFRRTK